MDRYDSIILQIIQNYRMEHANREKIKLQKLERSFWKEIETDSDLSLGQSRIGERITNLYLQGYIENKDGYVLTRKGKVELSVREFAQ